MAKEYVIYEKDGKNSAHTDSYQPGDGEKEVGRVEADSVDQAEKKFAKQQKSSGKSTQGTTDTAADDGPRSLLSRREPTQEEKDAENERVKAEKEAEEDFEVLADSKGQPYVEGEEDSRNKGKKTAKAEPPPEPEESSLGTFRAKDAQQAIAKAKGEFREEAEGAPRGAQTP
jgi:hypothetical protein